LKRGGPKLSEEFYVTPLISGQQRFWDGEAERLGGLEVDDQFEFGWLHNRQIGGLLPLENSTDIDAALTTHFLEVRPVADQAARVGRHYSSQTGIDAVINLRARHKITLADVERIVVRAGEITRLQRVWAYEPAPPAKLIFHMGYAMALAIRNGMVRPSDFAGEPPHDRELTRVANATEVIPDPELTAIYAERKLRDGRALASASIVAAGSRKIRWSRAY
jgi:hypothetical protein